MKQHDIVRKEVRSAHQKVQEQVRRHAKPFFTRDLAYTLLLAGVTIGVVSFSGWFVSSDSQHKAPNEGEILSQLQTRTVLTSAVTGEGSDAVVQYTYRGAKLPELLAEGEVSELRTESSYTVSEGKDAAGKGIYTVRMFSRPSYIKQDDGWYSLEYDHAPKKLFDKAERGKVALADYLLPIAHAATLYSGSGDGEEAQVFALDWSTAHDATSANAFATTSTFINVSTAVFTGKVSGANVYRAFLPFDTSSIPAGATITAATLGVYATSSTPTSPGDAYSYVSVVRTSQATHTDLGANDYDNIGTTEGVATGDRKTVSGISLNAYFTFPLNATGISWIAKAGQASNCSSTNGITCLGIRDGHDLQNVQPTFDATPTQVAISSSEASGTSQDPYLAVTYTAPFAFWQFDIF